MARPNQNVSLSNLQPSDQTRYNQAQAMQSEGMAPIQTQSYKGVTAAPSAAEGLAKALMAYTGAKRMRDLGAAKPVVPGAPVPTATPGAATGATPGMMSRFSSMFR